MTSFSGDRRSDVSSEGEQIGRMIGTEAQSLRVQLCRVVYLRAWAALLHGLACQRRCIRPWHKMVSAFGLVRNINERLEKWVEPSFDDIHALLSKDSTNVSLCIRILLNFCIEDERP